MNNEWEVDRDIIRQVMCEDVRGRKTNKNKDWMSHGTWDKVEERRKIKEKYLRSIIDRTGGTDVDIRTRIFKARQALAMLKLVLKIICRKHQNSNFQHQCKISPFLWCRNLETYSRGTTSNPGFYQQLPAPNCKFWWEETISTKCLWERTNQELAIRQLKRRSWQWIGHTLRKHVGTITRQALEWNPQGHRRPGRQFHSWRRSRHKEMEKIGYTWNEAK
ncbi:Hypothetical predicted protein [Mytilus galloprovincialis]|uniref:Endonuclease-reverse transcriptase n=1 Tax=Mytilus galloprovincialis TaxID=29158 RepID=A0A8B6H5X0_MYTGA|nr:Hypothetical predicted protein [Mytilus galloprovincialis]